MNTQQSADSQLRLYQVWKGRNKFFCGGRFIFGPDVRSLLLTVSLILAPVTLFWVFVSKSLVTGAFSHAWGLHIVLLSVILTICIICLLFLTSGSDPGIIPRSSRPPDPDDSDTSTLSDYWPGSQISASLTPLTKNVTVNGMVVKVKYCQTCMLYRPPRCSHCSVCNNCVERFDHHCPWVGQCIGKRNYRYFFFFVSSTTLLCLYVLTSCSINIKDIMDKENCTIWRAVGYSPITGFLIIYTFVVCWFVGGLTSFHLYLIATNQTTYENFRYQYDRKMNPYNLGYAGNFKEVFWSKIPRSQTNFRATVRSDSLAGSSASSCLGSMVRPEIPKGGFSVDVEKRLAVNAGKIEDNKNQVGSFGPEPRQNTSGIIEETGG